MSVAAPPPKLRKLTAAQRELAAKYLPLAMKIANKWADTYQEIDREEFESAAQFAILRTATKFDPKREGANFATLVHKGVRWALCEVVRKATIQKAVPLEHGDECYGKPLLYTPDPEPFEVVAREETFGRLAELCERMALSRDGWRRKAWRMFAKGATGTEVANKVGLTRASVSREWVTGLAEIRAGIAAGRIEL